MRRWRRTTDGDSATLSSPGRRVDTQPADLLARSDDVVQHLTVAKFALEIGDTDGAMEGIEAALGCSRRTITDLVRREDRRSQAGALVRSRAAASIDELGEDMSSPPRPRAGQDDC